MGCHNEAISAAGRGRWPRCTVEMGDGRRRVRGGVEIGKVMAANSAGWCSSHLSHVNGANGDTRW